MEAREKGPEKFYCTWKPSAREPWQFDQWGLELTATRVLDIDKRFGT